MCLALTLVLAACSGGSGTTDASDKAPSQRELEKAIRDIDKHLIRATGPWTSSLNGDAFGVHWIVHTAEGTGGGRCVSVETTPDLGGISVQQGNEGSSRSGREATRPEHLGRSANCVRVGDPNADSVNLTDDDPGPELLVVADADSFLQEGIGPHYALLVVNENAQDVVLVFDDKTTMPVTPTNGLAFLIWRDARKLVHVTLTQNGFEPPQMTCGAADEAPILSSPAGASCYND